MSRADRFARLAKQVRTRRDHKGHHIPVRERTKYAVGEYPYLGLIIERILKPLALYLVTYDCCGRTEEVTYGVIAARQRRFDSGGHPPLCPHCRDADGAPEGSYKARQKSDDGKERLAFLDEEDEDEAAYFASRPKRPGTGVTVAHLRELLGVPEPPAVWTPPLWPGG